MRMRNRIIEHDVIKQNCVDKSSENKKIMVVSKKAKNVLRSFGQLKRRKKRLKNSGRHDDQEEAPKLEPSDVYIEDPFDVRLCSAPMTMDVMDFWMFIDRSYWKGRLRVCDGELMRKLAECYDDLTQNKIIAKIVTAREYYLDERSTSSCSTQTEAEQEQATHVVRAAFTYYGGVPLKKHRRVSFATSPNSVFTPRIRHSLPIIKSNPEESSADPKVEALLKLHSQYSSYFPRLSWGSDTDSSPREWFISPIPEDLANRCIKAAQDFVVVKEQFIDNETWRTVTSITFSRKEAQWKTHQITKAMRSFYTSIDFPLFGEALAKRGGISKAKGMFKLKTSKETKYVMARSRNPQVRRTVVKQFMK